ncbi:hypothetical protein JTE90_011754 [Oedothorax gibbosus]|uniref:Uncharacterized protein n=1 Tax=Oedothorax gibbosus TaxID=931172 RepID=A0AAV6VV02_9ARAC|nr:hypothetical protein JTE90_011754 [Oedothorax gibbosus]
MPASHTKSIAKLTLFPGVRPHPIHLRIKKTSYRYIDLHLDTNGFHKRAAQQVVCRSFLPRQQDKICRIKTVPRDSWRPQLDHVGPKRFN